MWLHKRSEFKLSTSITSKISSAPTEFFQDPNFQCEPDSLLEKLSQTCQTCPSTIAWNTFFDHYYVYREDERYKLHPYPNGTIPRLDLVQIADNDYRLLKVTPPIDIPAQYIQDKYKHPILKMIELSSSEKYRNYWQNIQSSGHKEYDFVQYALTKKLYPNRPIFLEPDPKQVFPRLERLYSTENSLTTEAILGQVWCIYPMIRTDPAVWLILYATKGTESLRVVALRNGKIAEEGTTAYLEHALNEMHESKNDYTQQISRRISKAYSCGRLKYLHFHQEWNREDNEPGDIVQMQFHLVR
jgi:hypothetical protein